MRWSLPLGLVLVAAVVGGCLAQTPPPHVSRLSAPVALLTSYYDPNLTIQVSHFEGWAPDPLALEALMGRVEETVDKASVALDGPVAIAGAPRSRWSHDDLEDVHAGSFRLGDPAALAGNGSAFLHVMYLPGEGPGGVLGISIANRNYIFIETIRSAFGSDRPWALLDGWNATQAEARTLIHEFGHSIGLVDNGIPMVRAHAHPEDPTHSRHEASVMYVGAHTIRVSLDAASPVAAERSLAFDAYDWEDIRAFQADIERRRPAPP